MLEIENFFYQKLNVRKEKKTYRSLPQTNHYIDFSSNDYLGFATNDLLKIDHLSYGSGAKASRLISGNLPFHEALEQKIADYHHASAGLLFNSGYDANVGLFGCIASKNDTILYDELSHASIRDGLKMSLGTSIAFSHNDLDDLEQKLSFAQGNIFVATEGVFSMDGDVAPLLKMLDLCEKFHAALIIDEAHSTGVIGQKGKGLVCELGVEKRVFARVHTFGKAMGCHGAIVLGSPILRDYLINYARSFIFTTALPPHSLAYIEKAYEELNTTDRIQLLHQQIHLFKHSLHSRVKNQFIPSDSPIQSLMISGSKKVREIAQLLQGKKFDVKPIVAPTVEEGKERIRICIHAFNSVEEIVSLAQTLNKIVK